MKHKTLLLTLTFLLGSIVAVAQTAPANISGTYEGMIKRPGATAEEKVSLELKSEGGKITGRATHGTMTADITDGKLENGMLTLSFGKDAVMTVKVDGDKLVGEAVHGTMKTAVTLKKVTPAAAITPEAPTATAGRGAVDLNGQWDAVADANGQPFPFLLTLKIDGESVSGGSSSQLGDAQLKNGTFKEGRLSFQLEGSNGTISMSATIIEGKLSGEFDYAGQLQGKWVAVKKN
ncbi:MAG TPA: hypothetical protein VKB05_11665 [Pyrinomonadaceae bacterium]|nr:hypothetical protein [Pyrinomonadaceae bacterium]